VSSYVTLLIYICFTLFDVFYEAVKYYYFIVVVITMFLNHRLDRILINNCKQVDGPPPEKHNIKLVNVTDFLLDCAKYTVQFTSSSHSGALQGKCKIFNYCFG
jgi:hypothetical protein